MAKRIILSVSDSLHSSLKQRAAAEGVSLNALCSALLEEAEDEGETANEPEILDPLLYSVVPLDVLRQELSRVSAIKMDAREKRTRLMKINNEMANRYRL